MGISIHLAELIPGTKLAQADRLALGAKFAVANAAGGSAGAAVTTTVTFSGPLPTRYAVSVDPHQDATWYTTNRTSTGFDVVLTPRLAAGTLAAGMFDLTILA